MYAANNFGVHGASSRVRLLSVLVLFLRALFFARWPRYVYVFLNNDTPRTRMLYPFGARWADAPARYCDIIQRYDDAPGIRGTACRESQYVRAYKIIDYCLVTLSRLDSAFLCRYKIF